MNQIKTIMVFLIIFLILFSRGFVYCEGLVDKILPDETHLREYIYIFSEGTGTDEQSAKNDAIKKASEKRNVSVKSETLVDKKVLKKDEIITSTSTEFEGIEIVKKEIEKTTGLIKIKIKAKYKNPDYQPEALKRLKDEFYKYTFLNRIFNLKTAYVNPKKCF